MTASRRPAATSPTAATFSSRAGRDVPAAARPVIAATRTFLGGGLRLSSGSVRRGAHAVEHGRMGLGLWLVFELHHYRSRIDCPTGRSAIDHGMPCLRAVQTSHDAVPIVHGLIERPSSRRPSLSHPRGGACDVYRR